MRLSTLAFTSLFAAFILLPSHASALEGEWSFGAGGVFASFPTEEDGLLGVGATAYTRYGLLDQLSINLGVFYNYHPPVTVEVEGEEEGVVVDLSVVAPHLGLVWALDIIEVVPYVLFDATIYFADATFFREDGRNMGFGMLFGLGMDYRRWKSFSIGCEVAYHAFFNDLTNYPVYINANLHFTYHYVEPW